VAVPRGARWQTARQVGISIALVVLLASLVSSMLPDSDLHRAPASVINPVLVATGLDQGWGVFAPDPRQQSIAMRARITYADGTAEWWTLPEGDPLIGDYWDYRWRKYLEYVVNPQYRKVVFRPLAEYVARTHRGGGRRPVKIVFVARWYDLYTPLGGGPLRSPGRETAYYTLHVTDTMPARR
jgi:hypothetical protein